MMSQFESRSFNGFEPLSSATEDHEIEDQTINCIDCGQDFTWTVGEQVFSAIKA